MLHIDRMRMQLPTGYGHRASNIARLVGESLVECHPGENFLLDRLSIGPVQVSPNATDQEIANSVTERIILMVGRRL